MNPSNAKTKRMSEALYHAADTTARHMGADPAETASALLLAAVAVMVLNRGPQVSRFKAADALKVLFDAELARVRGLDESEQPARISETQKAAEFAESLVNHGIACGRMRGLPSGLAARAMFSAAITFSLVHLATDQEELFKLLREELELQIDRARHLQSHNRAAARRLN